MYQWRAFELLFELIRTRLGRDLPNYNPPLWQQFPGHVPSPALHCHLLWKSLRSFGTCQPIVLPGPYAGLAIKGGKEPHVAPEPHVAHHCPN